MPNRNPRRRRVAAALAAVLASPALLSPAPALGGHAGVDFVQQTDRVIGRVTAVGEPDASGNIFAFEIDVAGLTLNELRSWRVTFVGGALFAYVYQVRTNSGTRIEVTSLDGPLNGIAVGDGMLIEDLPIRRPTPQMRPPAPAAGV